MSYGYLVPLALSDFVRRHPARGAPVWEAERFLTTLVRGPEAVLVRPSREDPAAVAVMLDTCENGANAAELLLLGIDAVRATPADLASIAAHGVRLAVTGPRTHLDIATYDGCPWPKEVLAQLGFAHAYSFFELERPLAGEPSIPRSPLPAGLSWDTLAPARAEEYVALVRRVMRAIEGVNFPPREEYLAHTRAAAAAGHTRVLIDGSRPGAPIVAWVRTTLDEPAKRGELMTLGRDDGFTGAGLGEHLVLEGMRAVAARGAEDAALQVAASNPKALGLYERMGFRIRQETKILRKPLRPHRPPR